MDTNEHLQHHDDILRSLTAMLVEQQGFNQRVTTAIERIDQTLARLDTLVTEMFRERHNGRTP